MEILNRNKSFGGWQGVYRHRSESTDTPMTFSVYVPPQAAHEPCPVLYFLSGLTCTEANFTTKGGAQSYGAQYGVVIVAPDTSPRGEGVPDDDGWDMGQGAGFYVNATQAPWSTHYRMYDYVVDELPNLIASEFPVDRHRQGITGHSMGGHGALVVALKNPGRYRSVSALAPICAPAEVPWGHKAFAAYLGDDPTTWTDYDACALLRARGWKSDIRVDQGNADAFLEEQLRPELLRAACAEAEVPLTLERHDGYDHSFYFVSTFIGEHVRWHAERLG